MAISKIILNGVTQMDVTGKTVTAGDMLSGVTALKNDGTDITGNISNMTLPSASSSTSSGTSKATITPTSSAQYLNIPAGYLDTAQYYTIAAASGGASNLVTGTFKGTTTGAAMDVTLNYSGSGYPVAVVIYPTGGAYNSSAPSGSNAYNWYNLVKRYSVAVLTAVKTDTNQVPFQGIANKATVATVYKNSTSDATSYQRTSAMAADTFGGSSLTAQSSSTLCVVFKSTTKMSVYIASTSYGFAANIEYTYYVIYSS